MSETSTGFHAPASDAHIPCCLCGVVEEVPGAVEFAEERLRFVPAAAASDAVVMLRAEVVGVRLRPLATSITIATSASESITLRATPDGYTTIVSALTAMLPGAEFASDEGGAAVPRQGGVVHLELSEILTVGGECYVDAAHVWFEPGFDARLLGCHAVDAPIHDIRGVHRISGGRRVCIQIGDRQLVLRGPSAQRIWVALCTLRDVAQSVHSVEPLFFRDEGRGDHGGLFAVGASGFGYGGPHSALGLDDQSFWESVRELCFIRPEVDMVTLGCRARSHRIHFGRDGSAMSALRDRWLERSAEPYAQDDCFRVDAIMSRDGDMRFGSLGVEKRGVIYTPLVGAPVLLAARSSKVHVSVEEGTSNVLRVVVEEELHRVYVPHAAECAALLDGIFHYPSWTLPDDYVEEHTLSEDEFEEMVGVAAYSNLLYRGDVVAYAAGPVLDLQGSRVHLSMNATEPERTPPFPATLEVGNTRGRFMINTLVTSVQAGKAFSLKFTGRVRQRNRRDFFRLPVKACLQSVSFVGEGKSQTCAVDIWLVDLSRSGCGLLMPAPPDLGSLCRLEVLTDDDLVVRLEARVMFVSPAAGKKYRVGVRYTPDFAKSAIALFGQRERAALKKRREAGEQI
jgi:hypothetical protein